ncbi:uncharacterized protein LOC9303362 isoform X2 [Arabidopsis lyrata subsp. lyrata]|uniref:uncharacterized protein LOC9303362 isoform X2 n=1 Tax=Arabidopsis lyrata subsp. lyrata TaxID=81972 RepID=UPI000A29E4A4|nr:uncharacterized protein LOC9303362 isoform X2 [Arabidopsis lyrata subsp. lyrata]|eukprot:XP_020872307.1 uncharacterized protein LOC9303362 isoform X2 [Arabidopsis lyrata subsp. lyrata]
MRFFLFSTSAPTHRFLLSFLFLFVFIFVKVEHLMSKIEQSPPCPTMCELYPLIGALVSPKLFKHSDAHVKLAVAACICQITFITAPDLTYDDDQMKEVFRLIVSSFEHLSDIYSRSYAKRLSILETVHDVKLSRVMLNLECDALLVEMFQHFLNGIRDHHPVKVFSSMEHIMTLVVEESDDIPPQLLSPILHYVRKDDKIPQVSRKLAEQVLINCASKLKTYLADAVKSSGISLDKYSNIVASICEGALSALKQNGAVADKKENSQDPREVAVKDKQTARKVSTPISSMNENGHEAVSPRRETEAGVGVQTQEMRNRELAEKEDTAQTETWTHKRPRVLMEKTSAEGEFSCCTQKFSAEPGDMRKKLPQPCSVTQQLAKVKQSVVDTITSVRQFRSELETNEQIIIDSVRQFRSEIKKKEDNLEVLLQEMNVLGEKISGINKFIHS